MITLRIFLLYVITMQWVQEPFITNTAMQCYGYLSNIYISLRAEILRAKGVQKRFQKRILVREATFKASE